MDSLETDLGWHFFNESCSFQWIHPLFLEVQFHRFLDTSRISASQQSDFPALLYTFVFASLAKSESSKILSEDGDVNNEYDGEYILNI